MNTLVLFSAALLVSASASVILDVINANHAGSIGPSGIVTGIGAAGPAGSVTGVAAVGPAGVVTGAGAIGPSGANGHGIIGVPAVVGPLGLGLGSVGVIAGAPAAGVVVKGSAVGPTSIIGPSAGVVAQTPALVGGILGLGSIGKILV